jgi:PAS domain S-box-containing protein
MPPEMSLFSADPTRFERARPWLAAGMLLLVFWAAWFFGLSVMDRKREAIIRERLGIQLEQQAKVVEQALSMRAQLLEQIANHLQNAPDKVFNEQLAQFGASLGHQVPYLHGLAWAPEGVIRAIYPLEGNQHALGIDFSTDKRPGVARALSQAASSLACVLGDPVDVPFQGMMIPFWRAVKGDGKNRGMMTLTVRLNKTLDSLGLNPEYADTDLAISDGQGALIWGQAEAFKTTPVERPLVVSGAVWKMAACPRGGWGTVKKVFPVMGRWVGVFLGLGLSLLLALFLKQHQRSLGSARERQKDLSLMLAQLKEQELQVRTVLRQAPVAVAVLDHQLRFLLVSQRFCDDLKVEETSLMEKDIRQALPYAPQAWFKAMHAALDGQESSAEEDSFTTSDGQLETLRWQIRSWVPTGGLPGGILLYAESTTERKRAEAELQKARRIESLGLLAGGIAHDFNNLLAVVAGNLSLARLVAEDPQTTVGQLAAMLDEPERAAMQARELTQQLLTFSRGGAPVMRASDVPQVLRESAQFAVRGSHCSLDLRFDEGLPLAEMDPGQVSQVVHNLVLNAVQAMPQGGLIVVEASGVELWGGNSQGLPAANYVRVSVADKGKGIDESDLVRIFDPYFSTKSGGTGLGLATCFSIISRHGGRITAESKQGEGSRFVFYLPVASSAPLAAHESKNASVPPDLRVLVMDDEASLRDVVGSALDLIKCKNSVAAHGQAALDMAHLALEQGQAYDLAILDLTIPGGMGGLETLRHLRQFQPGIRAVVMSGYSQDEAMARHLEHGFQARLAKPFTIDHLRQAVAEAMA